MKRSEVNAYIRSPWVTRAKKGILAVCLIIIVSWIIVAVTISAQYDYDIWGGTFVSFNVFTIVAALCVVIAYGIYRATPSMRSKVSTILSAIPRKWNRLIDSGATPYFNPEFYAVVKGQYQRQVNPNIPVDQYGLPIVDFNIPLASFNVDIYKQYYRLNNVDFDNIKQATINDLEKDDTVPRLYQWEQLVENFYDLIREQLRIDVMGRTCWLVEPWKRKPLLLHKSNYISFIKEDIRTSGWETSMHEMTNNAKYEVGKVTGLYWLLATTTRTPPLEEITMPNRHIYTPIYKELWAISQLVLENGSNPVTAARKALYNFTMDAANKLGYPYLNQIFMELMMRSVIITQLPNMIKRASELIKTDKQIDAASFYKQLTDPSVPKSILTFNAAIAAFKPDPNLTNILTIIQMFDQRPKVIQGTFNKNMSHPLPSVTEGVLPECIRIHIMTPYLKKEFPDVAKAIKRHNRSVNTSAKCSKYLSSNYSFNPFSKVAEGELSRDLGETAIDVRQQIMAMDNIRQPKIIDFVSKIQMEQRSLTDVSKKIKSAKLYLEKEDLSDAEREACEARLDGLYAQLNDLSLITQLRGKALNTSSKISAILKQKNALAKLMSRLRPGTPEYAKCKKQKAKLEKQEIKEKQNLSNTQQKANETAEVTDNISPPIEHTEVAKDAIDLSVITSTASNIADISAAEYSPSVVQIDLPADREDPETKMTSDIPKLLRANSVLLNWIRAYKQKQNMMQLVDKPKSNLAKSKNANIFAWNTNPQEVDEQADPNLDFGNNKKSNIFEWNTNPQVVNERADPNFGKSKNENIFEWNTIPQEVNEQTDANLDFGKDIVTNAYDDTFRSEQVVNEQTETNPDFGKDIVTNAYDDAFRSEQMVISNDANIQISPVFDNSQIEILENQNKELTKQANIMKTKFDTINKQLEEKDLMIMDITREHNELLSMAANDTTSETSHKNAIVNLETQKNVAEKEAIKLRSDLKEMGDKILTLTTNLSNLQIQLDNKVTELIAVQNANELINEQTQSTMKSNIDNLNEQLNALQTTLNASSEQLKEKDAKIIDLERRQTELNDMTTNDNTSESHYALAITDLETQKNTAEQEAAKLRSEMQEMKATIENLQINQTQINIDPNMSDNAILKQNEQLTEQVRVVESKYKISSQLLKTKDAIITELQRQQNELAMNNNDTILEARYEETITNLETQKNTAEQEADVLRLEMEKMKAKEQKLRKRLKRLKSPKQEHADNSPPITPEQHIIDEQISRSQAELYKNDAEVSALNQELANLRTANTTVEIKCELLVTNVTHLEDTIKDLVSKNETIIKERDEQLKQLASATNTPANKIKHQAEQRIGTSMMSFYYKSKVQSVNALKNDIKRLTKEKEAIQSVVNELIVEECQLRDQIDTYQKQADRLAAEIKNLDTALRQKLKQTEQAAQIQMQNAAAFATQQANQAAIDYELANEKLVRQIQSMEEALNNANHMNEDLSNQLIEVNHAKEEIEKMINLKTAELNRSQFRPDLIIEPYNQAIRQLFEVHRIKYDDKTPIEEVPHQIEEVHNLLLARDAEKRTISDELHRANIEIFELTKERAMLISAAESHSAQIAERDNEIRHYIGKRKELGRTQNDTNEDFDKRIKNINKEHAAEISKLDYALKAALDDIKRNKMFKEKREALESEYEAMKVALSESEAKCAEIETNIAANEARANTNSSAMDKLEATIKQRDEEIASLSADVKNAKLEAAKLQRTMEEKVNSRVADATKHFNQKTDELRQKYDKKLIEAEQLAVKIEGLENELKDSKDQLMETKKLYKELSTKAENLVNLSKASMEKSAELKQKLENLEANYAELQIRAEQAEANLANRNTQYSQCLELIKFKELGSKHLIQGVTKTGKKISFKLDSNLIRLMIKILNAVNRSIFVPVIKKVPKLNPPPGRRPSTMRKQSTMRSSPRTNIRGTGPSNESSSEANLTTLNITSNKILVDILKKIWSSSDPKAVVPLIMRQYEGKSILLLYSIYHFIKHSPEFQNDFDRMRACAENTDVNDVFANSSILKLYEMMELVFQQLDMKITPADIDNISSDDIIRIPLYAFIMNTYSDIIILTNKPKRDPAQFIHQDNLISIVDYFQNNGFR